jgi:LacI family transcriptional regulator
VTTHDVAARAGVSQATVSLVLGGNPRARVAAGTRERVVRAARDLGYRPNIVARSLVRGRSYTIGVVVPELSNPFFLDVVAGVQKVATEAGYAVLLCDARQTSPGRHLDALRGRQVDGIVIDAVGLESLPHDALDDLEAVLVDEPAERIAGVASDALGAGRTAADHLLGLGHRRVAFIGPATDVHTFRMRERGFILRLREEGIALPSPWLRRAEPSIAAGQAAMKALLTLRERPTAVFCANDMLALGALKTCLASGVSVPGEMSLMGCDDIELARVVTPELSTIAVPARELGARAARLLLRRLEKPDEPARAQKPLPVRLMARGTTASPRAQA